MAGDDVRLGRRTLAALVERLERSSRTTIEHLLFKHALNDRFSGGSKLASLGNVFYPLADEDADPDEVGHARELLEEITLDLHQRITGASPWDYSDYDSEQYETMRKALRADGLDLADGRVMIFLTTSVSPAREQGLLERRLADPSFKVASEHLRQAIDNAARGNWESANSQVRSFLESLCEAIAARIFQGSGSPPTHGDARKYLATTGFLSAGESELIRVPRLCG